jgi:hypothetical protein
VALGFGEVFRRVVVSIRTFVQMLPGLMMPLGGFRSCHGMIARSICLLNATGFRDNLLTGFGSLERLYFVLTQKYHRNGHFQLSDGRHQVNGSFPAIVAIWTSCGPLALFSIGHPCQPMFEYLVFALVELSTGVASADAF